MRPKISILHPSYKRPELARKCYNLWMDNALDRNQIEYILCVAESDPEYQKYRELFAATSAIVVREERNGLINQVNRAAKYAMGNILIAVSDDFACEPAWDELLFEALDGKEDYLAKTQDGAQPWIITLPIMDRKYYNARGYIYHPTTKHMFCDTWITHEAHLMGKVVDLNLKFPHNHYTTGINPRDEVNGENDASWAEGERIYLEGLKDNFGVENPLPIILPAHHHNWLISKGVTL